MTRVRVRDLKHPDVSEVIDFDTFVEACDYVKLNLGPTLSEGYVIELETTD